MIPSVFSQDDEIWQEVQWSTTSKWLECLLQSVRGGFVRLEEEEVTLEIKEPVRPCANLSIFRASVRRGTELERADLPCAVYEDLRQVVRDLVHRQNAFNTGKLFV